MPEPRPKPVDLTPFLHSEGQPRREYLVRSINFDVITISGESGTLKTSVAKELAQILGVELQHRGRGLRETLRAEGKEIVDTLMPEDRRDEQLDSETRNNIAQAQATGKPVIIEGRLAGVILGEEKTRIAREGSIPLRALSVLITSDNEAKRIHRIHARQLKRDSSITEEDVAHQTSRRARNDLEQWRAQYPDLLGSGGSPFDPDLKNSNGDPVYDLPLAIDYQPDSLNTPSDITREAMVAEIMQDLASRGLIEYEVINTQTPEQEIPTGEVRVFRHLASAQNQMRQRKNESELYGQFMAAFNAAPFSDETVRLAHEVNRLFPQVEFDDDLPLAEGEIDKGIAIGAELSQRYRQGLLELPDRIVISPTVRARETAWAIILGFPELNEKVTANPGMVIEDERVKERSVGDAEIESDTKVYLALHPEVLRERISLGRRERFDFKYPRGENIPDVILRAREWDNQRDPNERVWVFSHSVFSNVYRLIQEGLNEDNDLVERYLYLVNNEPPPNGSMTTYDQFAASGDERGSLVLRTANEVLA